MNDNVEVNKMPMDGQQLCPVCRLPKHLNPLNSEAKICRCDDQDAIDIRIPARDDNIKYETELLETQRAGHEAFGRVDESTHRKRTVDDQDDLSMGSHLKEHPILARTQQMDGVNPDGDPNTRPDPTENPEAAREFDNELRLKMAKKLQAQNNPNARPAPSAPTPRPGGF